MPDYDGPERRRRRWPSWQSIVALLAVALAAWSILGVDRRNDEIGRLAEENSKRIREVAALTQRIVTEGRSRRDQSCRGDELAHLADVKRLRQTYRFLRQYPDNELVPAILQQLPQLEREARVDTAPDFCDAPGIGLKEPDPKVPHRPRFLQRP